MQGRLSPQIRNKIQYFPWKTWKQEFFEARKLKLSKIEWTLDYYNLNKNPLLNKKGQSEINKLKKKFKIECNSVTTDCFMQRPFWKEKDSIIFDKLIDDFISIISCASKLESKILVLPLVDNGSIQNKFEFDILKKTLESLSDLLIQKDIKIAFESDYSPQKLYEFIDEFDHLLFGINYDSGNSSSLGFNPSEEMSCYGKRIFNVHIKDRVFKGKTVPLTKGDADFKKIFRGLNDLGYKGNFILQTARAIDGNHSELIKNYQQFVIEEFFGKFN